MSKATQIYTRYPVTLIAGAALIAVLAISAAADAEPTSTPNGYAHLHTTEADQP